MDSIHFDAYTSYSDSSTPRTPSPHQMLPPHYKQSLDIEPLRNIFVEDDNNTVVVPESHPVDHGATYWNGVTPFFNASRGSLLQELYEHDMPPDQHEVYIDQSAEPSYNSEWQINNSEHHQQQHQQHHHHHHNGREYGTAPRRATFPYVRHDRDEHYPQSFMAGDHMLHHQQSLYGDPLPLSAEPSALHGEPFMSSPHSSYHHHLEDPSVKIEDSAPVIVPSQTPFYRPTTDPSCHPMTMSYLSPHTGLPVQHTDDAASKETQYLRRRCFNCHTTEPPSWRRSTLNPGKIVCNKCGLYERTHLRPRPLRFDELRAGNKVRKGSKGGASPKAAKLSAAAGASPLVKKEPREFGLVRRSSVSSSASSVHSGSGTSDWDDNGSAPPSSFNSPSVQTFPIPRDANSQSPPMPPLDGGIRLPNAPLNDIASLQQQQQHSPQPVHTTPRKAATATSPYYNGGFQQNGASVLRRGSMPERRRPGGDMDIPEATGWQTVPMAELKEASPPLPAPTAIAT